MAGQALRNGPLVPQLEHVLRQRIETGSWAVGQRLPSEAELAAELGVGRSSVREAVRLLARDGLLDVRHGVGTFVAEPPDGPGFDQLLRRARVLEVLEVRRALETEAARLAADRADREGVAALRRQVAERHARQVGGADAFVTADLDFHRSVVVLAGNAVLTALFDSVRPVLHAALVDMVDSEPQLPDTGAAHDALVAALAAGDGAAAVAATNANLDPMIAKLREGRTGE
ncbi:FadR/GntR family transcriptional regulator [Rhodococcus sp. SGAir0479]|uniref:FadR/GntR family transcriptional regulator n=1 Tax=Rhodococcus sp. SGAir0479 TaxID=2567884 RepID=UPI0010CCFFB3|nr:FCD domain-containing protein [Rhodococcus sp. SGAir0479]QCQ93501.1 FadR family transcriptional regulator [Rhodococcus sp. SGAir0479]